jgi:hypothetical protein
MLCLFVGLLRRRKCEKTAGLLQFIWVLLFLLILILNLLQRAASHGNPDLVAGPSTTELVFSILHGICFFLLLLNWPVLSRPALENKRANKNGRPPNSGKVS